MTDRTVKVLLKADVSGFTASMRTAQQATKDFTKNATESAGKHKASWDEVGKGMMLTGGVMAAGVSLAVKAFADFDAAMSQVQAGTGASGKSLDALRAAAIDAGAKTSFSATEAAQAITAMGKAGVSTQDILGGGLTGALDLAAAGQLDVASAAEIAATAMTQFGLSGKDLPHVADLLAAGAGKAQGSVQDLAGALKYVGPVAKGLGVSIEETTGILAMFASQGIIGEQAGTSMRGVLLSLTSPSKAAGKAMENLGLNMYDASGQFIGMQGAAGQLQAKLGPLSNETRNAALGQIFGNEQITAARILYEGGAPAVATWAKNVNDAGFAARQAAQLTDNLKGDVERLGGSLSSVLIQSGSGANGMLRLMTKELQGAVDLYGGLPVPVQQGATALGAVGAAALLAGGGLLVLAPRIQATKAALANMGSTGTFLSSGLGKMATAAKFAGPAFVVGAVALGYFAKQAQESKQRVDELAASLDQQTGALTDNTRSWVTKNLSDSGALESAKAMGISMADVTNAVLGQPAAIARANIAMNAYAIAGGDAGDSMTNNASAAKKLREQIGGGNSELNKGIEKTKLMAEANKGAGGAATGAAGSAKVLTQAEVDQTKAAEDNKKAHDDLIASISSYGSATLSARGDARSYEAAIDAATAAVKANGRTLDIGTDKGRNNQAALDAIATSALKVAESNLTAASANGTLGKATRGVTKNVADAREKFILAAISMGDNRKHASLLATQAGLTAGRVRGITTDLVALGKQKPKPKADVEITPAQRKIKTMQGEIDRIRQNKVPAMKANTAAAKERIADLQRQIANLKGKNIVVSTTLFGQRVAQRGGQGGITDNAAGGLLRGPGSGTSDSIMGVDRDGRHIANVSTGEFVTNARQTAKHLPLLNAINSGAPGFAGGGSINVSLPKASAVQAALNAAPDMFGGAGGGMAGSGVQRWLPLVLQALAMTGQSSSMAQTLLRRMNQESGGNPNAINLWDSNAKAGYPSRGLLQTIPQTFNAYRMPGLSSSIVDPLSNIVASIRYTLARYGSLPAGYNRAGGYAQGTDNAAPGWAMVGEEGPEWMKFRGGEKVVPNHKLDSNAMRYSVGSSAGSSPSAPTDMGGVRSDLMQQTQVLTEQTQILRALVPGFAGALDQQARTFQRMDRTKAGAVPPGR